MIYLDIQQHINFSLKVLTLLWPYVKKTTTFSLQCRSKLKPRMFRKKSTDRKARLGIALVPVQGQIHLQPTNHGLYHRWVLCLFTKKTKVRLTAVCQRWSNLSYSNSMKWFVAPKGIQIEQATASKTPPPDDAPLTCSMHCYGGADWRKCLHWAINTKLLKHCFTSLSHYYFPISIICMLQPVTYASHVWPCRKADFSRCPLTSGYVIDWVCLILVMFCLTSLPRASVNHDSSYSSQIQICMKTRACDENKVTWHCL